MANNLKLGLCPDCKAVVSRSASSCPKCGRPISEADLLELPKTSTAGCQWGCVIVVLIIILIMVIGAILHQPLTEEDRMRQIRKNQQTGRDMYR
jgi:hypothetical protein